MKQGRHLSPPKLATWLLKKFCRKEYLDEVEGDLLEIFEWRVQKKGWLIGCLWYFLDAISAFRLFKVDEPTSRFSRGMIFSFVKSSFRNLKRHWSYTILNVFGLAVGMAAALFILEFVSDELSYNQSTQSANIFRVSNDYYRFNQMVYESSLTFSGVGPAMQNDLPDVESFARIYSPRIDWGGTTILTRQDEPRIKYEEPQLYFADSQLMNYFDLDIVRGKNDLEELNTVLLSVSLAEKYFGGVEQALNGTLKYNDNLTEHSLRVAGVFRKPHFNLQIDIEAIVSYKTLERADPDKFLNDWGANSFSTFIMLKDGTDPVLIEEVMNELTLRYKPEYATLNERGEVDRVNRYFLTNIRDIHLHSRLQNEEGAIGNVNTIRMLQIIGLFVVIIAWINFINLTTAKSIDRFKEVGVRKVMGATKGELVAQFFTEAFLVNLFALIVAVGIVLLGQTSFNSFVEKSLSIADINLDRFLEISILIFAAGTALSGLYPSILLSSHRAVLVLKGNVVNKTGLGSRRGLIVFQLLFSSLLIISTITIKKQLWFMNSRDMGFDMEQVLVLKGPAIRNESVDRHLLDVKHFKESLLGYAGIDNVGTATVIPGQGILRGMAVSTAFESQNQFKSIERIVADDGFLNTLKVGFVAGRNFDITMDSFVPIILNVSASKALGFSSAEEALGKRVFEFTREERVIVGIIEDYHHESLNRSIDPTYYVRDQGFDSHYAIRISGHDLSSTVEKVEDLFTEVFPGNPVEHYFLDEFFERQYARDEVNNRVFSIFTFLSVVVACLGLYGLSSFTTLQRTKEIGVRKVLGANVFTILSTLTKEVMVLSLIGFLLSIPLAYYGIGQWLNGFAYHIEIGVMLFLLPLGLVLGVTLLAVGYKIIQTALTNPVESLRYE